MNKPESIFRNLRLNESASKVDPNPEVTPVDGAGQEPLEETVVFNTCPDCGELFEDLDVCPDCGEVLEEKLKVVVKDGKVIKKNIKKKKKKRLSAAQKAALAKARKKSHSGSANTKRKKSLKKRSTINDEVEETVECPECGYEGPEDEFLEDGEYVCPECGAELELDAEDTQIDEADDIKKDPKKDPKKNPKDPKKDPAGCGSDSKNESVGVILKAINAPSDIMESFNDGDIESAKAYLKENYNIEV